jgi:glycosyltransferase involved in cell wall biosynthesis
MKKVSVLVCAYNAEKYIELAIQSIEAQSYEDIELIVVNDGSSDSTGELLEKMFVPKMRLVHNKLNIGLVKSRTKALEMATGDFIALQDADDISLPSRIDQQVTFLRDNPEFGLVGTWADVIDENGSASNHFKRWHLSNQALPLSLLFRNIFFHSTVMFRREAIPTPPYLEKYPLCEDYHFITRVSKNHRLAILKQPLLQYRVHSSNISREKLAQLREISREIKREELLSFGIAVSEHELDLHHSIDSADSYENLVHVEAFATWFIKLKNSLSKCGSAFDEVLANEWYERCLQNSHIGFPIFRLYKTYEKKFSHSLGLRAQLFLLIKTIKPKSM